MSSAQRNSRLYLLISMAALSAFGPFITDFYLPALPSLQEVFDADKSLVQLSLTCSLLGLAFGQLIMGPLSDKYGRKVILLISLGLFIASTMACLLSWNIYSFVIFRLLQGIAGSGGIVISRSVVADLFEGEELAKFFALLGAINGLAPICAPIIGGVTLEHTNWRGVFMILLGIGVALLIAVLFFKESLPKSQRLKGNFWDSFSFLHIIKNKKFMLYSLIPAFSMGIMFSFIASSSFMFQDIFGLTKQEYGICFAIGALGIVVGSSLTPLFRNERLALFVGIVGVCIMGVITSFVLNSNPSLFYVEASFVIMLVFLGFILPTSSALAMELERQNAGNASAVLGFLLFTFGGIVAPLTSLGDNIFISTSIVILSCCACVAILGILALRK